MLAIGILEIEETVMLAPVLEVYVVWHPQEVQNAEAIALDLAEHFQGGAFGSLLSGAVEVYVRSAPWENGDASPRPIVWPGSAPAAGNVAPALFTAVVPIVGLQLARAVEDADGPWHAYLGDIVDARRLNPVHVCIFPLRLAGVQPSGRLGNLLSGHQYLGEPDAHSTSKEPIDELRHRDLAQGLAQWISPQRGERLCVFISHTKRQGSPDEPVGSLLQQVREVFDNSRVSAFFDAHDLQPGEDWNRALRQKAGASALLALRTDLYATREWCQREMLTAKVNGMPVVVLEALTQGEVRGSFLMDHMPRIPVHRDTPDHWSVACIRRAVNLLADAWLHRVLWLRQRELAAEHTDLKRYWWAPHAPEPSTFTAWLPEVTAMRASASGPDGDLHVLHPDPPLGADERNVLQQIASLAGHSALDLTTPRLLSARGA
ncbi:toll/interleukin-1 receptor domain-containing protein [Variovorax sp. J2P1-59]|uniref:toll/interleukin-1 receptor domain-containing protein n=1 Tax=Variovorax flavidus TaxID=3053501 RepID=UPI0025786187|nr:toll/interleukin-1 receptor domain-containing protein [Variovorax sp. J2P1-59]MDM0076914.1 toll/interleukin-1 receptor domain-containing protein [Variovorax sp. J2P1-59]